ncbi:CAP domain-containing protein [Aminipila sp.]|uniref:CAP domain-containing protein n=1 Tax=Aminipila sp. TaxID=2060095 RepID=UPI00289AC2C8|nr:CAP domain-containing protein [Aminipila sp.]
MKTKFVKTTLTLSLLLMAAAPTAAFAGTNCGTNVSLPSNQSVVKDLSSCFSNAGTQNSIKNQSCSNLSGFTLDDSKLQFVPNSSCQLKDSTTNKATTDSVKGVSTKKVTVNSNCANTVKGSTTNKAAANTNCSGNTCANTVKGSKDCTTKECITKDCTTKDCTTNNCSGNTCTKEVKKNDTTTNKTNTTNTDKNTTTKPNTNTSTNTGTDKTTTTDTNKTDTTTGTVGSYEQQVADLVNQERAKAGLAPVTLNTKLSGVAEKKAEDMRDKNYLSHTSPTYGSPFDMMKQFGVTYSAAGENIAKGQKTPQSVMDAWMNSSGHRANILSSNYDQIGVGYVTDSNGNTYWVQMFIK